MVLPSKCFETFGQTICESIALGVLPIVAGHGAMSETVDWLDCGVKFISDDVNSLSKQIYHVLTNYDEYDGKIAIAQEKIKVELGRRKYASEILSVYNSFYND
ncbi:Glycosyl transferases group 1 [compost metagenome]